MVVELDTADGAAWRARYNAPKLADAKVAVGDPSRGLAVSDHEGVTQLYHMQHYLTCCLPTPPIIRHHRRQFM
eukprot:COSAG02_NODE_1971_length_10222_cov_11.455399_6_plen_73_part_00